MSPLDVVGGLVIDLVAVEGANVISGGFVNITRGFSRCAVRATWKHDYNHVRAHSAHGGATPVEFAEKARVLI